MTPFFALACEIQPVDPLLAPHNERGQPFSIANVPVAPVSRMEFCL